LLFSISCRNEKNKSRNTTVKPVDTLVKEVAKIYNYPKNDFVITQDTVAPNDTFGKILSKFNLPYTSIYNITQSIKDSFNVKDLKIGRPYVMLSQKDSLDSLARPKVFIYEQNPVNYTVIDFQDSIKVFHKKKKVTKLRKTATVNIQKSLYQDIALVFYLQYVLKLIHTTSWNGHYQVAK